MLRQISVYVIHTCASNTLKYKVLGCTVRSVRAVNMVNATQKMQKTKQDDSSMSKVHQYRGLEPRNSMWWCCLRRRRRKMFTGGTIEQMLPPPPPPHLHVLSRRKHKNVTSRTSLKEHDKRPASGRRGAWVPGVVEGDGQDRPGLGVQHRGMQSRGHTGLGLTRGVKEVRFRAPLP